MTVLAAHRLALVLLCALLSVHVVLPAEAGGAPPRVVGKDDAGDWGGVDNSSALGEALGLDLIEAAMGLSAERLTFVFKVSALPDEGPLPGWYVWLFETADSRWWRLGSTCVPNSAVHCESSSTGLRFHLLDCGSSMWDRCEAVTDLIEAQIDRSAGTISVRVPLKALKLKPRDAIKPSALVTAAIGPARIGDDPSPLVDVLVTSDDFRIRR